jgi:hypothetical protein
MANKLRDAEDRLLESLFRSDAIADDGFSRRVVAGIRRRIWVRRLTLPIAILIGGCVAAKPALELAGVAGNLLAVVPHGLLDVPAAWIPQLQTVVLGALLLVAVVLGMQMLED